MYFEAPDTFPFFDLTASDPSKGVKMGIFTYFKLVFSQDLTHRALGTDNILARV